MGVTRWTVSLLGLPLMIGVTSVVALRQQRRQPIAGDQIAQPQNSKRKVIDHTEKSLPLRITKVRNLDSSDWISDMEFEVQNQSNRPIYSLLLIVTFSDVPKTTEMDGIPRTLGTSVQYGRDEFLEHPGELATDRDVPIAPGATAVLKLAAAERDGLKANLRNHNIPESALQRIRVRVDKVSFGDGSGYRSGGIPFSRRTSSNQPDPSTRASPRLVKASYVPVQFGCDGQPYTTCELMDEVNDRQCAGTCHEQYLYTGSLI
ncbi:MAG TPA: hypothetical protein VEZ90_05790 [Blastocatellia bacterium]|nr:hypothetical protein [Blastocatellia bacterium]